ncbi:MAG: heme biosynthesis protein HemY [Gammaproteobacteria bacterium]|nr:heme biosynthesis protein HemY [Gammaproteobacteria bacterium]
MKFRWYVLAGIFIGLLSVPFIRNIKGSTYILFDKTAIEFQNYFAVTVLVIIALVLWFGWILIRYLLQTSNKTLGWFGGRKSVKARQQTIDGMIALSEGHWKTAEGLLNKSATANNTQLINYLGAARAAQQQGDLKMRDHYLKLAANSEPDAQMAVGLTQVELQIGNKDYESALAGLKHLKSINANHPFVLKLLHKVYAQLNDWKAIVELLPKLKKHSIFTDEEFSNVELNAWQQRFTRAESKSTDKVLDLWDQLSRHLKKDATIVSVYANALAKSNHAEQAEQAIKNSLKQQWDNQLVNQFASLASENPSKALSQAEQWLKNQPNNAELLYCLGSLSLKSKLWGKATHYLEQSIDISPTPKAYYALAQSYEQSGHPINAQETYQKGLQLAAKG